MSRTILNELEDLVGDKLKVGDIVMWRGSWGMDEPQKAKVTGIGKGKDWDETYQELPWSKLEDDTYTVDIEVKDFFNKTKKHWACGYQLSPLTESKEKNIVEDTHEELEKAESEWKEKKKELMNMVSINANQIQTYLEKIKNGLNVTSAIDSYLEELKEIFNTIEDTDYDFKLRRQDLENEYN